MVDNTKSMLMIGAGLLALFLVKNGLVKKTGQQVSAETQRAGRKATSVLDEDRTRFQNSVRFSARRRTNRTNFTSPMGKPDLMVMS